MTKPSLPKFHVFALLVLTVAVFHATTVKAQVSPVVDAALAQVDAAQAQFQDALHSHGISGAASDEAALYQIATRAVAAALAAAQGDPQDAQEVLQVGLNDTAAGVSAFLASHQFTIPGLSMTEGTTAGTCRAFQDYQPVPAVCTIVGIAFQSVTGQWTCRQWDDAMRELGETIPCPLPQLGPACQGDCPQPPPPPQQPSQTGPAYADTDGDGVGDSYAANWAAYSADGIFHAAADLDHDGLQNLDEFRWNLNPVCTPTITNCKDYEGDNWRDGPEVHYWNNPNNDLLLTAPGSALQDSDATVDIDGDGLGPLQDRDSDNDGILDGTEYYSGTYPEFTDSDCAMTATSCTPPMNTTYYDQTRTGQPGTGDGLNDSAEEAYWNAHLGNGGWALDCDGDRIPNILDPDSDNDGISDGAEVAAGTNPCGDYDGPDNTVAQNDPTNQNLDEADMAPTNLQYLRNNQVDAQGRANETVNVVDQLVSAGISGNVTQALNVLYNATPIGGPLRNATAMVLLAQDAVVNLVRCADGATTVARDQLDAFPAWTPPPLPAPAFVPSPPDAMGVANNPTQVVAVLQDAVSRVAGLAGPVEQDLAWGQDAASSLTTYGAPTPSVPNVNGDPVDALTQQAQPAQDVASCASRALLPFVDELLTTAVHLVPDPSDVSLENITKTVSGVTDTANAILPVNIATTTHSLLTDPIGTTTNTALTLAGYASDPQSVQGTVTQANAAADAVVQKIINPSTRNPQFLYDTLRSHGLYSGWALLESENKQVVKQTGGAADPLTVVDAPFMNLYTNRSGHERITALVSGKRTCIPLDSDPSTKDSGGCDMYATMLPSGSLTLEKAVAAADFQVEALGYMQVANEPYVLTVGYDTVPGAGLPATWHGSVPSYGYAEQQSRDLTFTQTIQDPRASMPLSSLAAVFRVITSSPAKPHQSGYETVLQVYSAAVPASATFDVHQVDPTSTVDAQTKFTATTSAAADWAVQFEDDLNGLNLTAALTATGLPAGTSTFTQSGRDAHGLELDWTSTGTSPSVALGFKQTLGSQVLRATQFNADQLGSTWSASSDPALHNHTYAGTASSLNVLAAEGGDSCHEFPGSGDQLVYETAGTRCMSFVVHGITQAQVSSDARHAAVQATRSTSTAAATSLLVKDGNIVSFLAGSSPASWTADLAVVDNQTQTLHWTSASSATSASFGAVLHEPGRTQILQADATQIPTAMDVKLNMATGSANLTANAPVGATTLLFSNTGHAPTRGTAGQDYLRYLEAPANQAGRDFDSAWHVEGADRLTAQMLPDGSFDVAGHYAAARPLSVLYKDESNTILLNASSVIGTFHANLATNGHVGTVNYTQDTAAVIPRLDVSANMPGGRILLGVSDAPRHITIAGNLANQQFLWDASAVASSVNLRYGPDGTTPNVPGSNTLVLQQDPNGARGLSFSAAYVQRLNANQIPGTITEDSRFAGPSNLRLRFLPSPDALDLSFSTAPAQGRLDYASGSLHWTSPASSTVLDFRSSLGAGPIFQHFASTAPSNVAVQWSNVTAPIFDASVTHSTSDLSDILVEEYHATASTAAGAAGFYLDGLHLAPASSVHFEPANGVAQAYAKTTSGATATTGHIVLAYGQLVSDLVVLDESDPADGLIMQAEQASSRGAIDVHGLQSVETSLFLDPRNTDTYPVHLQHSAPYTFAVDAVSTPAAAHASIRIQNAAPTFDLGLKAGTDALDGFRFTETASAPSGALTVRLLQDSSRDAALQTGSTTPSAFTAAWQFTKPFQLQANAPFDVAMQSADDLSAAPWDSSGKDFLAVHWDGQHEASARFASHLTGQQKVVLDPVNRRLDALGSGAVAPIAIDDEEPHTLTQMQASDLPSSLAFTWDPTNRSYQLTTAQGLASIEGQVYSATEEAPRLYFDLQGIAAGSTTFRHDMSSLAFHFGTPTSAALATVAVDNGGIGPIHVLTGQGIAFATGDDQSAFRMQVQGAHVVDGNLLVSNGPTLLVDDPTGSSLPMQLRFAVPDQSFTGHLDAINSGILRLQWPIADPSLHMVYQAAGIAGRTVGMTVGGKSATSQMSLRGASSTAHLDYDPTGALSYTGSAGHLDGMARWGASLLDVHVDAVPNSLSIVAQGGMLTGQVTNSWYAGRMDVVMAPTGSDGAGGAVAAPDAAGGELLSVDTTQGNGVLVMDLMNVISGSWSLPSGSDSAASTLAVTLNTDYQESVPAVIELLTSDHQTLIRVPGGVPPLLACQAVRSPTSMDLDCQHGSQRMEFQHQDSSAGTWRSVLGAGPVDTRVTYVPRQDQALLLTSSASAVEDVVDTNWGGSYLSADLKGVPAKFAVKAGNLVPGNGQVSTMGTGIVSLADLLFVPDGEGTVNYVSTPADHAAVELTGKTPYLGLTVHDFSVFSWTLPDVAQPLPFGATIQRGASHPGQTVLVLTGPREDVTARILNAAPTVVVGVTPRDARPAGSNAPVQVTYQSLGGATSRVDVTHVGVDSGQTVTSYMLGTQGSTTLSASGAEPAFIQATATGSQGGIGFQTTDQGTALKLDNAGFSGNLLATVTRGTCGATSPGELHVRTANGSTAGRTLVQIGDHSTVPSGSGDYVDFRCDGNGVSAGLQVPFLQDLSVSEGPCTGVAVRGIPANSPTPVYFADTRGLYNIMAKSGTFGGGYLTLTLDCSHVAYQFDGVLQNPASLDELDFGYRLLEQVHQVTNDCIPSGGVCMLTMNVTGSNMPSHAEVAFNGGADYSDISIAGGQAGNVDIGIVVEAGGADKNVTHVRSTMPMARLRFITTDHPGEHPDTGAPNQVVQVRTDSERTQYVTLDHPAYLDATIQKGANCFLQLDADLRGSSGGAFEFYQQDAQSTQRATMSNLPNQFSAHLISDGLGRESLTATTSSVISSLRYVTELPTGCNKNVPVDVFAMLTGIPAGSFEAGWQFGAAGFVKAVSQSGFIGDLDVGLTDSGDANRYLSLHLGNARLDFEWDFDGDTRYGDDPRFAYCDTGGGYSQLSLRSRFDTFGFGVSLPGGAGLDLICNAFQLRYEPKVFEVPCMTNCGGSRFDVAVPWFKADGNIGVPINTPNPYVEMYAAGRWWHLPDKLVMG